MCIHTYKCVWIYALLCYLLKDLIFSALLLSLHHQLLPHYQKPLVTTQSLLVLDVSATLQSIISLKIIYALSVHVFTSYSLSMLFNLASFFSMPLKIPLSWNTSSFSFLDNRFPWGSFYFLVTHSQFFFFFIQWVLFSYSLSKHWASLIAQLVKNLPAMRETPFQFLGREDSLEKGEGIGYSLQYSWASLVAQLVKNLPAMWETIPGLERSSGEGNGYPLQSSGLENSVDCIVHAASRSRTRLILTFLVTYSQSFFNEFFFS